nr:hypothetical protein [Vibrio metoecus]
MVTAQCGSFCISCLHPLTRRYNTESIPCSEISIELLFVH